MDLFRIILNILLIKYTNSLVINNVDNKTAEINNSKDNPDNVFNGVYTECFLHLSYSCLQKKTLLYLKELNNLSEVSVLGDYVKFVKINTTILSDEQGLETGDTDELASKIDKAVDDFFDNHVLKFNALGRDISIPRNMDEFVGRKKRKGGGGGGESMMGGHGHDDKKKMMMMAMMCMKMKLMMMVPAMMGMMGMMSFKGMMFSMMSFMISKMMLLMKILEKRGGAGGLGGSGGGGDAGWAAAGGGGAWMPAGGQDYAGGGYDANGQWQSRSIAEIILNKPINNKNRKEKTTKSSINKNDIQWNAQYPYKAVEGSPEFKSMPEISYVKPTVRFNNKIEEEVYKKPVLVYKKSNVDFNSYDENRDIYDLENEDKSPETYIRAKRSLSDLNNKMLSKSFELEFDNQRKNTEIIENFNKEPYENYGLYNKNTDKYKTHQTKEETNKNINKTLRNEKENSRQKRSTNIILDLLQNSYTYWMTKLLGTNNNRRTNFQKYRIVNGVRYVYYPFKAQKTKTPKEIQLASSIKFADEFKPIITAEDFNKGEIMEGAVEARMQRKKFNKMKDTVNDTLEDNPWQ